MCFSSNIFTQIPTCHRLTLKYTVLNRKWSLAISRGVFRPSFHPAVLLEQSRESVRYSNKKSGVSRVSIKRRRVKLGRDTAQPLRGAKLPRFAFSASRLASCDLKIKTDCFVVYRPSTLPPCRPSALPFFRPSVLPSFRSSVLPSALSPSCKHFLITTRA